MRKALVVGFAWVLGCGSATDTLPPYPSSVSANPGFGGDGAIAFTGVGSSSGSDAMVPGGEDEGLVGLRDDDASDSTREGITPSEDGSLDAAEGADASRGVNSSDSGNPQDSNAESSAKPQPDASTGQPEASTPRPDASTGLPDASTEKPDASTGVPDASTEKPDASTALPDASMGKPDAAAGPPACLSAGVDCTSAPDACCSGICSPLTGSALLTGQQAVCADPCSTGPGCVSGCCVPDVTSGMLACAPRGSCPATCIPAGSACTSPADCCGRETCISLNGGICAALCTFDTDCPSGCCVPLDNASGSVCVARQFCP
jgi:hypothetical protein